MKSTKLLLKSIAGMLNLILVMALTLFLPMHSINYLLAWLYLAAFFAPVYPCIKNNKKIVLYSSD
ncbi:MAG: hypothetical protein LBN95_12330 [Prevotellaceae bacterium]|jgi:hypothetical protein|nr:hypothetical protein [Prevotellaceae bacterium]